MMFLGCCTECSHDLIPVENGDVSPEGEIEMLCSIWGAEHGTHWSNPKDYLDDATEEYSDEGSSRDYR